MDKKILEKLNKMIALSKNNGNEGDTALAMAEKLMNEYGISYEQLEESKINSELGEIGVTEAKFRSIISPWEKLLAKVIAEYFDCSHFITIVSNRETNWNRKYSIRFVGHESNRITAEYMYEWIKKLLRKEARKNISNACYLNSYCYGAVSELYKKYHKETKEKTETGLVVVSAVQRYMDENLNLENARKSRSITIYSDASAKGAECGKKISLARQAESKDSVKYIA